MLVQHDSVIETHAEIVEHSIFSHPSRVYGNDVFSVHGDSPIWWVEVSGSDLSFVSVYM